MNTAPAPQSLWISGVWGFAEATVFFVVPDVVFTGATVVSVKRGWLSMAAAIFGAVVGGAVMYLWADARPLEARALVASVPFVGEKIVTPRETLWNEEGTAALFANPLSGVPYKVDAILAPSHVSLPAFILLSVPLRFERMLLSIIVFTPIGLWVARGGDERTIARRRLIGLGIRTVFWVIVYVVYWSINWP
jgi:membrane protein YqaA with SNARE-associated domain